jgi:valyl-tRNA synthetase
MTTLGDQAVSAETTVKPVTLADRWILSRYNATVAEVGKKLEHKEYSAAGDVLREFTWTAFADWYLEIAKIQRADNAASTDAILRHILSGIIRLWHPFMPYVTEAIWKEMGNTEMIIVADYPKADAARDEQAEASFEAVQGVIVALRALRAEYKVEPAKEIAATIAAGTQEATLKESEALIRRLARVSELTIAADAMKPEGSASTVAAGCTIYLPLAGLVDVAKERARITADIESTEKYVAGTEAKLANAEFTSKAPEKVVADMRNKLEEAKTKLTALETQRASLG